MLLTNKSLLKKQMKFETILSMSPGNLETIVTSYVMSIGIGVYRL